MPDCTVRSGGKRDRPGCWGAISTPYWKDSFILSSQCHQHWYWGAISTPYWRDSFNLCSQCSSTFRDGKVQFGPVVQGIFENPEPDYWFGPQIIVNLGPDHWFGPKWSGSGSQEV